MLVIYLDIVFVLCLPPYIMDTACVHLLFCSHGSQNGGFMYCIWDTDSISIVLLRSCIPPSTQGREFAGGAVSC